MFSFLLAAADKCLCFVMLLPFVQFFTLPPPLFSLDLTFSLYVNIVASFSYSISLFSYHSSLSIYSVCFVSLSPHPCCPFLGLLGRSTLSIPLLRWKFFLSLGPFTIYKLCVFSSFDYLIKIFPFFLLVAWTQWIQLLQKHYIIQCHSNSCFSRLLDLLVIFINPLSLYANLIHFLVIFFCWLIFLCSRVLFKCIGIIYSRSDYQKDQIKLFYQRPTLYFRSTHAE